MDRLHFDLTDDGDLARLRGRVVAVTGALGALLTTAMGPAEIAAGGQRAAVAFVVTLAFALGVFAIGLRYGARFGERTFATLILVGITMSAQAAAVRPYSSPSRVALAVMAPLLIGAVFSRSWSVVLLQAGWAMGSVVVTEALGPVPGGLTDIPLAMFNLGAIALTVRLIWVLALGALHKARRGEVTDPLTGVANRRGLETAGGRYWTGCARERRVVGVVVIDVDHFKRVNDVHGHAAGDDLLRRLAGLLSCTVREEDVVARLGGEEFAVLCSLPAGQTAALAERIRDLVEQELAPVTVSLGVHEVLPEAEDDVLTALWAALDRADVALYQAKSGGRNQVVVTGS